MNMSHVNNTYSEKARGHIPSLRSQLLTGSVLVYATIPCNWRPPSDIIELSTNTQAESYLHVYLSQVTHL